MSTRLHNGSHMHRILILWLQIHKGQHHRANSLFAHRDVHGQRGAVGCPHVDVAGTCCCIGDGDWHGGDGQSKGYGVVLSFADEPVVVGCAEGRRPEEGSCVGHRGDGDGWIGCCMRFFSIWGGGRCWPERKLMLERGQGEERGGGGQYVT